MTISTSGAKVYNSKGTHSQMDLTCGSKQRSSSSESGHETSVWTAQKRRKRRKSIRRGGLPTDLLLQRLFHSPCISHQTQWSRITTGCWMILLVMQFQIKVTRGSLLLMNHQRVMRLLIETNHWEILLQVLVIW